MIYKNSIMTFFDCLNKRDLAKMGELIRDTAEFYFPNTRPMIGRDRILRFFRILFRQYSELLFDVHLIIIQDENAAVQWTNRGNNRKNEPYENEGVTIFREEDGLIVYISDFFKDTGKF